MQACAGVGAGQAADPEGKARISVGSDRARSMDGQEREGDHAVHGAGPSAGLFRGESLPRVVDLSGVAEALEAG